MTHPYSLAFLTTSEVGPAEAVHIAAETGYDLVGLRFLPAAPGSEADYPVMTDPAVQREVAQALAETGVKLADIEIARLGPETDIASFEAFCALGQRFSARHVLVAGDDPEPARLTETFGRFCELAKLHGLTADLEFMPWTAVKTIADARRIVESAGHENGGVLIDALHFDRCGSTLDEVRSLPHKMLNYAQLCDGPAPYDPSDQGMIQIARAERLLPGEGGIDLVGLVRALPEGIPLSIEVPRLHLVGKVSARDRAHQALEAAKAIAEATSS
ncbi:sugar phosphate isomerase/epimerase family protein [Roseibium aggregatum]|uniref:Sugar phosphate isomerase/epimerase n=1 Tax=Roseibium aggregatum TaxID=187304 RepID=A0A926P435_9HYPH|nr:sugar phosphate isomerase/epimerase [Roseibium aggregatum]MBD1549408.1 sugar phosphate isomerase/epimerase [Roseibium aggregatum]